MKGRISITLALTVILVPLDLRISHGENIPANSPNCTPVGRIIRVENDKIPAGKLLCSDEFIELSGGAKVEFLCFDSGEILQLPSGTRSRISERCLSNIAKNDCTEEGCHDDDPRGPLSNKNTPEIITPYNTNLINPKPPLSWYAVKDATGYIVRVKDITGTGVNWEREVPNSSSNTIEFPYPTEEDFALQPGHQYKLIVEAKTPSSSQPGEARFTMLSLAEIQEVQAIVVKIDRLNLPEEEKILFDLYSVYSRKELFAEIVEKLENLVQKGSQTPKVYRLLGEIYLQQSLFDLAKQRYDKAVELATNKQDTEELAAAEAGLERINRQIEEQK